MGKEKLIPWTIRNCDEENFEGMGWLNREKGILFLDWTRQGNNGWTPSDAARGWAEQKGHLKKKKPRDLKAGLRNAFRSKYKHLEKVVIPKKIAGNDGRKRMLWKFIDVESERQNISNPSSKSGQKKKSATRKSQLHVDGMMIEENSPSCSSTLSDFEYGFSEPKEINVKVKSARKKGGRTKQASTKEFLDISKPLPPIQSLMRNCGFNENVSDTYQLPVQSQDISSTVPMAQFSKTVTDYVAFPPKLLYSYPSTPPHQKTDVMYDDKREDSYVSLFSLKSVNYFSNDQCQDSLFMSQSDESRQSPHSSSPLWNIPIHTQSRSSLVRNQLDEGIHSPHANSPEWSSPIHKQSKSSQVLNQSDNGSHSPHSLSPTWNIPIHTQSQSSQILNQADEDSHSSHYRSPLWNSSIPNQFQGSQVLSQSEEGSQSPHSSSPLWNSQIHNQSQSSQVLNQSDEGSHSPHSSSPLWNSQIHNLSQSSQVLNQSDEGSHSPHSSVSSLDQFQTAQILNQSNSSRNASQSNWPLWLCPNRNQLHITQAPNQADSICEAQPLIAHLCFSSTNDQFQKNVIQSQNTSSDSSYDNLLRVTSPSLYTDVPELNGQCLPAIYENQSIFLDFPEIPPLEFPRPEEVLGFEDDTENIFLQLNIQL